MRTQANATTADQLLYDLASDGRGGEKTYFADLDERLFIVPLTVGWTAEKVD